VLDSKDGIKHQQKGSRKVGLYTKEGPLLINQGGKGTFECSLVQGNVHAIVCNRGRIIMRMRTN
jgi:hypothetical protein